MLDERIIESFTLQNFKNEFYNYESLKTDKYTNKVNIQMGTDGISYETFKKDINHISKSACSRAKNGTYFFHPFREQDIPKPPYTDLEQARAKDKVRTLSVASIRDVIFQKLIYNAIEEYCEDKFSSLKEDVSYGYRKNKSAPLAIQGIYKAIKNEGYSYVLDADIKTFFDDIPHDKLRLSIQEFFPKEDALLIKYLKRFYSVDKVKCKQYKSRKQGIKIFHRKNFRTRLKKTDNDRRGIPQGGVLSGLLANIYLYDFDKFVLDDLYAKYRCIKYFRYADDFIILSKDKAILEDIFEDIKIYLKMKSLNIHELEKNDKISEKQSKTKILDLSEEGKEQLEFLGFKVSPRYISIKGDNIIKFKNKINDIIKDTKIYHCSSYKGLEYLIKKISFKILGNMAFEDNKTCEKCSKKIRYRNWITYFSEITDARKLKSLDIWIRKRIYNSYYKKTGKRLNKKILLRYEIPSLERIYYEQKSMNKKNIEYCNCDNMLIGQDVEY